MEQEQAQIVRQISGLSEISDRYDAILCDIWGVVHNGVASFAAASDALVSFRGRGGAVVLISNAPRPFPPVKRQVLKLGVSPDAFDAIVTSGDVTIGLMEQQPGDRVLHIGPERDLSLFDAVADATARGRNSCPSKTPNMRSAPASETTRPKRSDHYEPELQAMAARGLPMICANPDIVIHRGETLIYCAGALAHRYEELGGSVVYAGKPYAPIYDRALALAERFEARRSRSARVLAIGDGMKTDIIGRRASGAGRAFCHRRHSPVLAQRDAGVASRSD